MNYCPINRFELGIAKEFQTPFEYASAIKSIFELNPDAYLKMCTNVRDVSIMYDYKSLTKKFVNALLN
jgi:hypothetical protein